MHRTSFHRHISSLPELVAELIGEINDNCRQLFKSSFSRRINHIFITGCGDSYHAAVSARLGFMKWTGLNCQVLSAMEFARYQAAYLSAPASMTNVVVGVSASGQVSRTIEALELASQAQATTVAITGDLSSPLAQVAEYVLPVPTSLLEGDDPSIVVPGARSFVASLLALYLTALAIGTANDHLSSSQDESLRHKLKDLADTMDKTIARNELLASRVAQDWLDAECLVFCGAGPNYGSALFSAAKVLEASGEPAVAQEMEEWAHLEYFSATSNTPTFLIGGFEHDQFRAQEIATAAKAIGRRLAIITPINSKLAHSEVKDFIFPLIGEIDEAYSPLLATLPTMLFSASRALTMNEPYFRAFAGGRNVQGGGGISRIRTSRRIRKLII